MQTGVIGYGAYKFGLQLEDVDLSDFTGPHQDISYKDIGIEIKTFQQSTEETIVTDEFSASGTLSISFFDDILTSTQILFLSDTFNYDTFGSVLFANSVKEILIDKYGRRYVDCDSFDTTENQYSGFFQLTDRDGDQLVVHSNQCSVALRYTAKAGIDAYNKNVEYEARKTQIKL